MSLAMVLVLFCVVATSQAKLVVGSAYTTAPSRGVTDEVMLSAIDSNIATLSLLKASTKAHLTIRHGHDMRVMTSDSCDDQYGDDGDGNE